MKFYSLLVKYGLKTAFSDLKLRIKQWWVKGRITWRNIRLWKMWKRNTDIMPIACLVAVAISGATLILSIPYMIEINNNITRYYECPTIRRILVSEVSAKEMEYKTIQGEVSAYNALPEQTDGNPCITADGTNICGTKEKIIANNCLPFNTIVEIDGIEYRVADRMNKRYSCNHFDILFESYQEAINFGRQTKKVIIKI